MTATGRHTDHRIAAAWGAVLAATAVLVAARIGAPLTDVDAQLVLEAARAWPGDVLLDHRTLRPAVVLPLVALEPLVGIGSTAMLVVGAASAIVLALATARLTARFGSPAVAPAAGVVVLLTPWVARALSRSDPDLLAAAAVTSALALVPGRDEQLGWSARRRALVITGSLVGVAALARAPAVLVLLPLAALAAPRKRREFVALGLPVAAAGLVQVAHDLLVGGGPLQRLTELLTHNRVDRGPDGVTATGGGVFDVVLGMPRLVARQAPAPLWLVVLAVGIVGLVVLRRRPRVRAAAGVVLATALPLWLAGGLLGDGLVRADPWEPRLWLAAWPALVAAGAATVALVLDRVGGTRLVRVGSVIAVAAAVVLAIAGPGRLAALDGPTEARSISELRVRLAGAPQPVPVLATAAQRLVLEQVRRGSDGAPVLDLRVLSPGSLAPDAATRPDDVVRRAPTGTLLLLPTDRTPLDAALHQAAVEAGWRRVVATPAFELWARSGPAQVAPD